MHAQLYTCVCKIVCLCLQDYAPTPTCSYAYMTISLRLHACSCTTVRLHIVVHVYKRAGVQMQVRNHAGKAMCSLAGVGAQYYRHSRAGVGVQACRCRHTIVQAYTYKHWHAVIQGQSLNLACADLRAGIQLCRHTRCRQIVTQACKQKHKVV